MAGVTVRMNTEARRQEIVRAALETIGEHGVVGATVSRIAKGAGITPAALYAHFENRRAILLAALDVVYEQVFDSFESSSNSDPVQKLRAICEHHAEKVRSQDKTSHAHLFLEFVASAPEEGLREALREKELVTTCYLASIIDELKQQGGLAPDVDSEMTAWLVAGWAWTGDVASLIGVTPVWYERVSPRLLDFILGSLSEEETGEADQSNPLGATRRSGQDVDPEKAAPATEEAMLDGLPSGAVFTVEEVAEVLKISPDVMHQMVLEKQIGSLRFGCETRIPRRALLACLRGVTAEEFEGSLDRRI